MADVTYIGRDTELAIKDPNSSSVRYTINYSSFLNGLSIVASSWISDVGITAVAATPGFTPTTTTVLLSGGTAGISYYITNRITLDNGETDLDHTFKITCEEK